jgi:hypothetical protein
MLLHARAPKTVAEVAAVPARFSWRRLPWALEVFSIALGYGFYSVVRVLSPQNLQESYENAALVVGWERGLGILSEVHFNTFLSRHDLLTISASYYYATLHFLVTPLVLIWLFYRRKQFYAPLRSSLVIGTLIALVIYATWPLAPPRFALPGVIDSVTLHPVLWGKGGHGVEGFINELAAMPSLHVGWAVWVAFAIVAVTRGPWRHLAWLYPAMTTVVVVATANHYLLDAVGGALVILLPLKLCGMARDMASTYPPPEPVTA